MTAEPSLRHTLTALKPVILGVGAATYFGSFVAIAVLEVVAVALLPVFLAALNDPRSFLGQFDLRGYGLLQRTSDAQIVVWLGIVTAGFFVLKNLVLAVLNHYQATFVAARQATLSTRMLSIYLRQPYTFHLQRNSAELIAMTTGITFNVFACIVIPGSIIATEILVIALIAALLMAVSPLATLSAIVIIGGISFAFYRYFRVRLHHLGELRFGERNEIQKWASQTLGGIKETIILGCGKFFEEKFARHVSAFSRTDIVFQTYGTLPRLFVETVVVCGLVMTAAVLLLSGTPISALFPTLALFGVAALRLMPSVTRVMSALSTIKFYQATVDALIRDLSAAPREVETGPKTQRVLKHQVEARGVFYTYAGAPAPALRDISLGIERGSMVALVGRSGSGKSTLVDLLIGLHRPSEGAILVDGQDIAVDLPGWQRNIGYVPQSIFLTDDSLRRNVAFGLADAEIDDTRVLAALEAARLGDFVSSLPGGLSAAIGERGSRISGGQRQRIGIARALYRDPDVLVLDEPTTALDRPTAEEFGAVLAGLVGRKTILLIAHQMSSVRLCKRIFVLDEGNLAAEGSYEELLQSHPRFQMLVE